MTTILGTAISGMAAATKRAEAAAQNVVNAGSYGTPGASGPQRAYRAVEPIQTTDATGAPHVKLRERNPATVQASNPTHPLADMNGFVEMPNVDIAREMIDQNMALHSYKANVKLFELWETMQRTTLDLKS